MLPYLPMMVWNRNLEFYVEFLHISMLVRISKLWKHCIANIVRSNKTCLLFLTSKGHKLVSLLIEKGKKCLHLQHNLNVGMHKQIHLYMNTALYIIYLSIWAQHTFRGVHTALGLCCQKPPASLYFPSNWSFPNVMAWIYLIPAGEIIILILSSM